MQGTLLYPAIVILKAYRNRSWVRGTGGSAGLGFMATWARTWIESGERGGAFMSSSVLSYAGGCQERNRVWHGRLVAICLHDVW